MYIAPYNVTSAGTYVLRVGILVPGLNGTFFSGTNLGGLKGNAFDKVRSKEYSTVQYSTVQYSTVQYSTVQYSTVQYSAVHYSTV